MKLLAFDPAKQKMVLCGDWDKEKNVLFREVKPEHYMKVVQGYGIQEIVFQQLLQSKVKWVALKVVHTGYALLSKVEVWKDKGKVADYGHGKQRFLSEKYMMRRKYEN